MDPIRSVRSRTVVLPRTNIDTDQIIPARFLTTTAKTGLGRHLFEDWRYDAAGRPRPEFVLNDPSAADCEILVAGRNLGCGSSREHAAWALLDYGIRAVVSNELADIFTSNALKNGLLPVVVDAATHAWLLANPGAEVAIDVARATLTLPDGREAGFPLEGFARRCLLEGVDEAGYLLARLPAIAAFEARAGE